MTRKRRQQTIEATLGRPTLPKTTARKKQSLSGRVPELTSSPARSQIPSPSFLPSSSRKRPVVLESSSSSAEETAKVPGDDDDEDSDFPVVSRMRQRKAVVASSPLRQRDAPDYEDHDDDEDDLPRATPRSMRRKNSKRSRIPDEDEDEEKDDGDDDSVRKLSSLVRPRRLVNRPSKPAEPEHEDVSDGEPPSSPSKWQRKTPRSGKEKARELLRRKRAGEVIEEEEEASSSSDDGAQAKALYDTDSEHEVLAEFEDDDEGFPEDTEEPTSSQKAKAKTKAKANEGDDMDDFVVEDDDAPLGVPDGLLNIPLQFTAHSHKPLKEHFRHAVEWLVQSQINPGFPERQNDVYRLAWRRLGDEVSGLASSKFSSAAWKADFQLALRARPSMESLELTKGDPARTENCGACGRSNHPATFRITFTGTPYYKEWGRPEKPFMDPVEVDSDSDSEDSDSDTDDSDQESDVDEDGNSIPKPTKQWFVGSTCNSNADTAHTLLHWKKSLLDWVEATLESEGHMKPESLAKTRKLKPSKREKLVDEILAKWEQKGTMNIIYSEFTAVIDQARNKSTAGRRQRT